jgi:hypothetical protein
LLFPWYRTSRPFLYWNDAAKLGLFGGETVKEDKLGILFLFERTNMLLLAELQILQPNPIVCTCASTYCRNVVRLSCRPLTSARSRDLRLRPQDYGMTSLTSAGLRSRVNTTSSDIYKSLSLFGLCKGNCSFAGLQSTNLT